MSILKKFNDDFSFCAQPSIENIHDWSQQGFKSVLNLRTPGENGFLADSEAIATKEGMKYVHLPFKWGTLDKEFFAKLIDTVDSLPKPAVVHCLSGGRASVGIFVHSVVKSGGNYEDVKKLFDQFSCNIPAAGLEEIQTYFKTTTNTQ
eukprot:TRINITY_DN1607_c0_g9_i1.p1 TRINITY_DN1607_c0_g9~~TRINITY_DN1607_c0_g9_i1.p1  ORF type:complete len:148 (+),score=35.75 TRINITY_DN1607_c0_g9_i1:80-523(+)